MPILWGVVTLSWGLDWLDVGSRARLSTPIHTEAGFSLTYRGNMHSCASERLSCIRDLDDSQGFTCFSLLSAQGTLLRAPQCCLFIFLILCLRYDGEPGSPWMKWIDLELHIWGHSQLECVGIKQRRHENTVETKNMLWWEDVCVCQGRASGLGTWNKSPCFYSLRNQPKPSVRQLNSKSYTW